MKKSSKTPMFKIVQPTFHEHHNGQCSTAGMFGRNTFFVGGGKENYEFQSLDQLVDAALAVADAQGFTLPEVRLTKGQHYEVDLSALFKLDPMAFPVPKMIRFVAANPPTRKVSDERRLAHIFAGSMIEGLFEQPVHQFFAPDFKTLIDDKPLLAREYWEIADSLRDQLLPAQEQVIAALPKVMTGLRERYADASTGQLYQAALQLIGQQLAPILSTIQMWTTGFRQSLDPKLQDSLKLVRAIIESNLVLSLTGNLNLDKFNDASEIKQVVPTFNVSVGDVVLPVLIGPFDSGPAVIPMASGALGPRGGHLAFVPWNLIKRLPLIVPIYMHEVGHLLQSVIKGFMQTYAKLIQDTINKAHGDGTLVFDEEFVMIGNQKVPAVDFFIMVFMGQLPELDADNWGTRASGPAAFIRCFSLYVAAMTEVAVGDMDKVDHVLRMGSSWSPVQTKDGKVMMKLEPHPQDGPRIGSWQAALAKLMGYPEEAAYATAFANSETGTPIPTRITWVGHMPKGDEDEDQLVNARAARKPKTDAKKPAGGAKTSGNSGSKRAPRASTTAKPKEPQLPTISASVKDYDKVANLIAAAFLSTKTECLNGMSLAELVNMTPTMHGDKVVKLKDLIKKGIGKLPDSRHYFFHTVGSAAIEALFELVKEGVDPDKAMDSVCEAAMSMMLEILPKWEADVKRLNVYGLTDEDVQPKN